MHKFIFVYVFKGGKFLTSEIIINVNRQFAKKKDEITKFIHFKN
jgi:hypothetical protein